MLRILSLYRNAFGGLSQEAWLLSLVIFIQRSGAMVVPFLSVYLTQALGFNLKQVGVLLSLFGMGAAVGNFLGGWLTDKLGHFKVQVMSFFLASAWFFTMLWVQRFEAMAAGLFLLSILTESLRPANAAAVSTYSTPESVTRAFSLNRMAINLGFVIGPALGGMLAMVSYKLLFLSDSLACLAAGIVFFFFFRNRPINPVSAAPEEQPTHPASDPAALRSPYQDGLFLVFTGLCCCFLVAFSQLFTTLTIYWHQVHHLTQAEIGALLAFDGILVFLLEMVIVYQLSKVRSLWKMIVAGSLLLALAFALLNVANGLGVLVLSVLVWGLAELLALPFMSTLTVHRSNPENRGAYMGLHTLAYSVAFILGPLAATHTIDRFGFDTLWWGCSAVCVMAAAGLYVVVRRLQAS
jgi:predicted MFS family arabinose efflux permease